MGGSSDADASSGVGELLDAYARLLAMGADRGTRLRRRLRPAVGVDRALAAHVRGALDLLDRRYRLQEGLGSLTAEERSDAERVRAFAQALPAPRRLRAVLVAIAILVVTQLLTFPLSRGALLFAPSGRGSKLNGALSEVAKLDPASINDGLALLLTTNVGATAAFLMIGCVAAFLVLRLRAAGDAVAQRLVRRHVGELERATFARLGIEPPPAPALRIAVAALPALAGLLLAISFLELVVDGQLASITWTVDGARMTGLAVEFTAEQDTAVAAIVVAALGAARLGWLAVALRRRGGGVRPSLGAFSQPAWRTPRSAPRRMHLAGAAVFALCAGVAAWGAGKVDRRPPGTDVTFHVERIGDRRLAISLACDQLCRVRPLSLSGAHLGTGARLRRAQRGSDSRAPVASAEPLRMHVTIVYRLSRRQQRALARRRRGVAFGLDVADGKGNVTSMCIPVWDDERTCRDGVQLEPGPLL